MIVRCGSVGWVKGACRQLCSGDGFNLEDTIMEYCGGLELH